MHTEIPSPTKETSCRYNSATVKQLVFFGLCSVLYKQTEQLYIKQQAEGRKARGGHMESRV